MNNKSTKTKSNTGIWNGDLFCFNCGQSQKMPLPMPITMASDMMKSFERIHKACKKTWTEPIAQPGDSLLRNLTWWLKYGEHGISSKTMAEHLGRINLGLKERSHPRDPSDFKRCYLLLKAVPQFKEILHDMKSVSSVWSNLVDNWDKLTELLEEQLINKTDNGMYDLMKKIGC